MAVAMKTGGRIESLLSARLFLNPQLAGDKLYFVSDLAGRLSLYRMDVGGSVPEPLLPPGIALQNPELLGGYPFYALPDLDRIVLMLDQDGDENYQPNVIPLDGGFPEPLNEEAFSGMRTHLLDVDGETATATPQPSRARRRRSSACASTSRPARWRFSAKACTAPTRSPGRGITRARCSATDTPSATSSSTSATRTAARRRCSGERCWRTARRARSIRCSASSRLT